MGVAAILVDNEQAVSVVAIEFHGPDGRGDTQMA